MPKSELAYVMQRRKKGLPESEDSVEKKAVPLQDRKWRRKRWRKHRGEPVVRCAACGVHLNRRDTYYVRPAYTDGKIWLCAGCYDRMTDEAHREKDHRYGRRSQAE